MKTTIFSSVLRLVAAAIMLCLSTVPTFAQNDPSREILVYFTSGAERAPAGQPARITSTVIQSTLARLNIGQDRVSSAFPDFNEADTLRTTADGRVISMPNMARIFTIRVPEGLAREAVINSLKRLPMVLFAEPNGTATPAVQPNDQYFQYQWGLRNGTTGRDIHATEAWDIYTGNPNNIIAIVDWGVDATHPDLSNKVLQNVGYNGGHGIHVAGIAAAKSNNWDGTKYVGIAGVDWNAQILPERVDGQNDQGIYNAIMHAVNWSSNVHVLNNSWRLTDRNLNARYSTTVAIAFANAYKTNRVAVAAMGNYNYSLVEYPAGFHQGIIAVGATNSIDPRWDWGYRQGSNYGNHIDVVAPGVNILSTYRNGNNFFDPDYYYDTGTSMATPHISGIASLLKGYSPNLYNDDIQQIIQLSADKVGAMGGQNWTDQYGYGRVNARKALDYLRAPYVLTQASTTGGTIVSSTGLYAMRIYGAQHVGLPDGDYIVNRHEVRKQVSFSNVNSVNVWGRGVATNGWNTQDGFGNQYALGFCEPVPGTVTSTGATVRTYLYVTWYFNGWNWIPTGWYPTTPANALFAYTIHGIPQSLALTTTDPIQTSQVAAAVESIPGHFALSQNYPNPFNPETEISFALPERSTIRLTVLDMLGREIATLTDGERSAGYHRIRWNGSDANGNKVGSGIYFYRLTATGESGKQFTKVMKLMLLK